jgi:hypothetical protein
LIYIEVPKAIWGLFLYLTIQTLPMKKTSILLLLILLTFSCFAQDRKALEERADKMYAFITNSQYDSLIDYTHPSLFKSITKSDFIAQFKKMNEENNGMKITVMNTPAKFNFGEIKHIGYNFYNVFYYDQTIKIAFTDYLSEEDKKFYTEAMIKKLNAQKGTFNDRMNALFLLNRVKVIAVADNSTNYNWSFFASIQDHQLREQLGL